MADPLQRSQMKTMDRATGEQSSLQQLEKAVEKSALKNEVSDGAPIHDCQSHKSKDPMDATRLATKRTWEISNALGDQQALLYAERTTLVWGTKSKRSSHRRALNTSNLLALKAMLADNSISSRSMQFGGNRDIGRLRQAVVLGSAGTSRARSARQSSRSRKTFFASLAETSDEEKEAKPKSSSKKKKINALSGDKAISTSGYTCRGRVKQKAQKRVDLIHLGERKLTKGWFNAGYIFPLGFKSKTQFRSSVHLDALCVHECEIVRGEFWPLPTFVITANDRPSEKLTSKSCTGCWTLVLNRIKHEINRRRKDGENLPPPPKTAIAGPEYFGLIQPDILRKIEALDTEKKCEIYWAGKMDRQIASRNLSQITRHRSDGSIFGSYSSSKKRTEYESEGDDEAAEADAEGDGDDDACCTLNKWSALCRSDRYRQRCINRGSLPDSIADNENPLPDLIDLITMQPVVTPAISPYGHVMGIATWRAWLSENRVCPFTRNPLTIEQCTILTKNNIDRYRGRITNLS